MEVAQPHTHTHTLPAQVCWRLIFPCKLHNTRLSKQLKITHKVVNGICDRHWLLVFCCNNVVSNNSFPKSLNNPLNQKRIPKWWKPKKWGTFEKRFKRSCWYNEKNFFSFCNNVYEIITCTLKWPAHVLWMRTKIGTIF